MSADYETDFDYEDDEPRRCEQCYEQCEYLGDDRKVCCYCIGDSIKEACETCYWNYDNAGCDA